MKKHSLRRKITITIIGIVVGLLACVGILVYLSVKDISGTFLDTSRKMGKTAVRMSSSSLTVLSHERLEELASDKADMVDEIFRDFVRAVSIVEYAAEELYYNPDQYADRPVPPPDKAKNGSLSVQTLYSAETDPDDTEIKKEAALIGNLQETLFAVNANFPIVASNYFATESGIMIQADYISASKFDENGNLMPMEAKERPWYQGAVQSGIYITSVVKDVHTPRLAIMCGMPVYCRGELKGVSGAGMYLDDIDNIVQDADLDETGDACIINKDGEVLFSTLEEGSLLGSEERVDLRKSENRELASTVTKAVNGGHGLKYLNIDGKMCYLAYAPLKTIGWTFFIILSKDKVEEPTKRLSDSLNKTIDSAVDYSHGRFVVIAIFLSVFSLAALIIAVIMSWLLSRRIAMPIQVLTEKVGHIDGDDLDFTWDMDTRDETQVLAASFQSLTQRMKSYIEDINHITAERERIITELTIARQIQSSMLPNTFPAFPDCPEFDIYASMNPAKEVGGDFYDYFLIDDDHLGLVIADVSGKGVPAALFMMMAKIVIYDNAMMNKPPAQVLTDANTAICANNDEDMFLTVWLGILEISTGRLTACNAGHEYPVIKERGGSFHMLYDEHGFVLGGMEEAEYTEYVLQLTPGSKIFLYTDGIPEACNEKVEMFGTDRMLHALNEAGEASPEELLSSVQKAVDLFAGDTPQFDDLTMLCFEYRGKNA